MVRARYSKQGDAAPCPAYYRRNGPDSCPLETNHATRIYRMGRWLFRAQRKATPTLPDAHPGALPLCPLLSFTRLLFGGTHSLAQSIQKYARHNGHCYCQNVKEYVFRIKNAIGN